MPITPKSAKPLVERTGTEKVADKAVEIACKQLDAGLLFKQARMNRVKEIEEMLAMKKRPALAGQFNIPFDGVIMLGFKDSLLAKVDEPPALRFKNTKEAAYKAAKKITAAAEFELSSARSNFAQTDRAAKSLAIDSGRAIYEVYGESDPEFQFCVNNVDHFDFVTEPNGGARLSKHLFDFQMNLFRTKREMKRLAEARLYNAGQVSKLINATTPTDFKENDDDHKNKVSRFASKGLDAETNNYVGEKLFNLTKGVMIWDGEPYYIVFDRKTRVWVRFAPLKEVFESGLSPWVSWATHEDPFNFWSLGPCDVMYPIADARRVNLNAMLNNARKRSDPISLYATKALRDPLKLMYRPEGFAGVNLEQGQSLQDVVKYLAPEDITNLAIRIEGFMNQFAGQMTGVTPSAQGNGQEELATILESNIQQVADRIGLLNKSYSLAHEEIGRRFDWALYEHAPEEYMVKILGPAGTEWDRITKEDKDPDFEVTAVSARAEQQQSQLKADKQQKSIETIVSNPILLSQANPRLLAEEVLRFGDYNDERIRQMLDTKNESDEEVLSEAARLMTNCLEGAPIETYKGATTGFVQKIIDYASKTRLDDDKYFKLMALAEMHIPIAQENMLRKAVADRIAKPAEPMEADNAPPAPPMNV